MGVKTKRKAQLFVSRVDVCCASLFVPDPFNFRFDDASDILKWQAQLYPQRGDILYRAGLCAINQGRWSRCDATILRSVCYDSLSGLKKSGIVSVVRWFEKESQCPEVPSP